MFLDSLNEGSENNFKPFYDRIIEYSYPVFIKTFYDPNFEHLPGSVHKHLDNDLVTLYSKLIYSCGIIGWMQSLVNNVTAGYLSYKSFFNHVRLKFNEKYHWNEYIEQEYLTWYSSIIAQLQMEQYEKLNLQLPEILHKLSESAFVWNKHFMGYSNDMDIEIYFNTHAYLDAQQSVAWDVFPPDCFFDGICFESIIQAIIDFAGYSIKHLYYARVLNEKYPELLFENLLSNIFTEEDIIQLISSNQEVDRAQAEIILSLLSLTPKNKERYDHSGTACSPLIKVSESQYVRSIKGFLHNPFAFMLLGLRESYSQDWDRNVNTRESTFRAQLYSLFDGGRFICIPHPIYIKDNGKTNTDIDAAIIDKNTGEMAFFQLKWQDPTGYSSFALRSKANNYNEQTQKWLDTVQRWINSCSDEELASKLGVKKKYLNKEKVMLFVLGRHHGNYSGDNKPNTGCVWVQWYQLLHTIGFLTQHEGLSIEKLYEYLNHTNPFNRRIIEPMTTFVYGKYRIYYGGGKIK